MRRATASKSGQSVDWIGDEYEIVSFRLSWGAVSLLFFLLTLPARFLLDLQPWRPQQIWLWPLVPPVAIAALALLGLVTGLIGLRFSTERQGLAKMGVLLNAAVLGIILLIAAGMAIVINAR